MSFSNRRKEFYIGALLDLQGAKGKLSPEWLPHPKRGIAGTTYQLLQSGLDGSLHLSPSSTVKTLQAT